MWSTTVITPANGHFFHSDIKSSLFQTSSEKLMTRTKLSFVSFFVWILGLIVLTCWYFRLFDISFQTNKTRRQKDARRVCILPSLYLCNFVVLFLRSAQCVRKSKIILLEFGLKGNDKSSSVYIKYQQSSLFLYACMSLCARTCLRACFFVHFLNFCRYRNVHWCLSLHLSTSPSV